MYFTGTSHVFYRYISHYIPVITLVRDALLYHQSQIQHNGSLDIVVCFVAISTLILTLCFRNLQKPRRLSHVCRRTGWTLHHPGPACWQWPGKTSFWMQNFKSRCKQVPAKRPELEAKAMDSSATGGPNEINYAQLFEEELLKVDADQFPL